MKNLARTLGLTSLCFLLTIATGCERTPRRGGAGESCMSADDCQSGLACLAQVCVKRSDGGVIEPSGTVGEGGKCSARRDCQNGLNCVANVCTGAMMGTDTGNRYSGRGESCQAANDCEPTLACTGGICRQVDVTLSRTSKSCFRVECEKKDDCCADFVPNANCADYKSNCDSDPVFCVTYRSLCECDKDCVGELCVSGPPGCMSDGECTSAQTPFCVDNKCRQCNTDTSCMGSNTKCVDGVCMAACTIDENCPALHSCQNGECVETGCTSDRECAFLLNNSLATCNERMCLVPCATDSDCMSASSTANTSANATPAANMGSATTPSKSFQICDQGQCVFVGCDSDAECRALLGLQNETGTARAVCK